MRRQKKVQYSPLVSIPHYDGHFSIDCFLCDCIILLLDSQCLLRVMTTMSEADIVFRRCMEDSGAFKLFVSQSIWVIIFAPCTQRYVNRSTGIQRWYSLATLIDNFQHCFNSNFLSTLILRRCNNVHKTQLKMYVEGKG